MAVVVGSVLAFGLALLAHRRRGAEQPISIVSALVYTFPSIALFQLLVPFTGLTFDDGRDPARPLHARDPVPELPRRARGAPPGGARGGARDGPDPNQILWRVEVPLARPAMIGGLRIAVVSTVAIATIAASIGENDLGAPIFYAIHLPTPFKTEIYSAGFLAVALALLCDAVLVRRGGSRSPGQGGDAMIFDQANAHTFVEALGFIVHNPHLLSRRRSSSSSSPGPRSGWRSWSRCRSGSSSATSTAARASRSAPRSSVAPCRASS